MNLQSIRVRRALISVSDKTGVVELAKFLAGLEVEICSTGGTAKLLQEAGLQVTLIADITEFPEIMDGRVKTLHPKIFGGILANRQDANHRAQAEELQLPLFDLVVVNLYPFADTIERAGPTLAAAIENIDIGGVTLIRAAAKNHQDVAIVTAPEQYAALQQEMERTGGLIAAETRKTLAVQAFAETAIYDARIHDYFHKTYNGPEELPRRFAMPLEKERDLRYGENPHQKAAQYRDLRLKKAGVLAAQQLHGKELSYNNLADADAAYQLVRSFQTPAAVIVKHANPCGVATAAKLLDAYERALATDSLSAFGGIVGLNREVDPQTAEQITGIFTEVVVAPGYTPAALDILRTKKNLRLLEISDFDSAPEREFQLQHISSGILLQDKDLQPDDDKTFEIVSQRPPSDNEWQSLLFGWKVVRWVKSNAIVYTRGMQTIGIGAGQMSRVDASELAVAKARKAGLTTQGTVVASDAFFPFADGIEAAAAAGATAVIQPGGSVRDAEVIDAADRHKMAMVFTRMRHFRH